MPAKVPLPTRIADGRRPGHRHMGDFREGREIDALFARTGSLRRRSSTYISRTSSIGRSPERGRSQARTPSSRVLGFIARASRRARREGSPVVLETIGAGPVQYLPPRSTRLPRKASSRSRPIVGYLPDRMPWASTTVEGPRDPLPRAGCGFRPRAASAVPPERAAYPAKRTLYQENRTRLRQIAGAAAQLRHADLELREGRMNGARKNSHQRPRRASSVGPKGSRGEDEDLVGTYGATFAENPRAWSMKLGLSPRARPLSNGGGDGPRGEGPSSSGAAITLRPQDGNSSRPEALTVQIHFASGGRLIRTAFAYAPSRGRTSSPGRERG